MRILASAVADQRAAIRLRTVASLCRATSWAIGLGCLSLFGWSLLAGAALRPRKNRSRFPGLLPTLPPDSREPDSRYRELFEHNPLPAWIYDRSTLTILDVNRAAAERFHRTREDLAGMPISDEGLPPELLAIEHDRRVNEGCFERSGEWREQLPNGAVAHFELIVRNLPWRGRQARLVMIHDIAELLSGLQNLRVLFQQSADGYLLFDAPGIIDCNPGALRMLGATDKKQLLGLKARDFSPQYQADGQLSEVKSKLMAQIARLNGFHRFEWTHQRLDGSPLAVEVTATPVELSGSPSAMICVLHDLSERKEAEERLAERVELTRAMVDHIPDALITSDDKGVIESFNPAAESIFGYAASEAIGRKIGMLVTAPGHLEGYETTGIESMIGRNREMEAIRKDGSLFPVELTVNECRLTSRRIYTGVLRDITVRKREEEALRNAKEAAELATSAKSEFLASMSHEIRTPMNGVIGITSLLLESPLAPEQRDYVETIRASGDALLCIVNDILDFSKIEAGKMNLERVEFEPGTVIEESVELIAERAHSKRLELNVDVDVELQAVYWGDPGRLRQILLNLLSNAVKFTERGGVTVRAVRENSEAGGYRVRFAVTDTGIGITPAQRTRLFESFVQADSSMTRRYGGTGLGLAISKKLIVLMGGEVGLDSIAGEGSTFWFTVLLPFQGPSRTARSGAELVGKHALIVDGSAANRKQLGQQLKYLEMTTTEAADGAAALAHLLGERFDLAVLNLELPGMSGLALVRAMRSQAAGARLPILMLFGQRDKGPADEAECLGISYLVKPIRWRQLVEGLRSALAAKTETPRVQLPAVTPARGRILLAEDNATNQRVAMLQLRHLGFQIDVAANGLEAVEAYRRCSYELILMDGQMPEMDGFSATRAIRELEAEGRRTPIIALTANALDGDRQRCLEAGMDDYLSKPLRGEALAEAVLRWTGQEAVQGPTMNQSKLPGLTPSQASRKHLAEQGIEGELADEVIQSFLGMIPELLGELDVALRAHDLLKVKQVAHSMRGGCGNMGLEELAAALRELETGAAEQPMEWTEKQVRAIEGQCQECSESIRSGIS